jgi:hypothetical protein
VEGTRGSPLSYSLRARPKSNDYDLVDGSGVALGQVIHSANGFTVYLFGDLEPLLSAQPTADEALEAFEDWAASNTTDNILIIPADEE